MIAISAHALGRRVPRTQWIALVVLGVISIVIIGQVRELGSGTGAILSTKEVKGVIQAGLNQARSAGDRRLRQFDRLSLIQEYVPAKVAFQYGHTFIATLAAPVPRVIWRNKPLGAGPLLANAFRPEHGTSTRDGHPRDTHDRGRAVPELFVDRRFTPEGWSSEPLRAGPTANLSALARAYGRCSRIRCLRYCFSPLVRLASSMEP